MTPPGPAPACADAYRDGKSPRVDEATATFLDAAADDLQRQAGLAGIVERITAETARDEVALIATI
ncbi:MAG TPA: hypothetical protein VLA59_04970, partial [Patescibacteria group bacterium]|nr:hypothetical protein [Patescibacteria group bacterium]